MRLLKIFLLSLAVAFSSLAVTSTPASGQLIVNSYRHAAAFTTEYQAVLDRATTLGYTKPSAGQQVKQNQLIVDLKAAGIWTQLDVFYVFATDGDSDFATLNWKAPASFQCVKVNSPTFTSNLGFTGNGTTNYLDTQWIPNTHGVNYTLDNASFFADNQLNTSASAVDAGAGTTVSQDAVRINSRNAANEFGTYVNDNVNSLSSGVSSSIGFGFAQRKAGNFKANFKNGTLLNSFSQTRSTRPIYSVYILGMNIAGTLGFPRNMRVGIFGAGASLNGLEGSLYTYWNAYFTSL